jgi:2-polyprenyl-3-methyl-5-hydroxy-6-metoxy-1,4-benzoquinol methylase
MLESTTMDTDSVGDRNPARKRSSGDDWDEHWSSYAASNALNPAQEYRRKLILQALDLARARRPIKVLEVGSGQGDLSREITERHPTLELVGVDISETGVKIAQAKVPAGRFFQQDLMQPMALPTPYRAWATHAICSEVLEHLDDPLTALRHARTCLAPGARLIVTVPAGPMSAFDCHIGHRRHFTPAGLRELLTQSGLRVASLYGAGFPFFNLYRLTVITRGQRLVEDATDGEMPVMARMAMRAFSWLFRMNTVRTLRGWQLIAVAVEPDGPPPVTVGNRSR